MAENKNEKTLGLKEGGVLLAIGTVIVVTFALLVRKFALKD